MSTERIYETVIPKSIQQVVRLLENATVGTDERVLTFSSRRYSLALHAVEVMPLTEETAMLIGQIEGSPSGDEGWASSVMIECSRDSDNPRLTHIRFVIVTQEECPSRTPSAGGRSPHAVNRWLDVSMDTLMRGIETLLRTKSIESRSIGIA